VNCGFNKNDDFSYLIQTINDSFNASILNNLKHNFYNNLATSVPSNNNYLSFYNNSNGGNWQQYCQNSPNSAEEYLKMFTSSLPENGRILQNISDNMKIASSSFPKQCNNQFLTKSCNNNVHLNLNQFNLPKENIGGKPKEVMLGRIRERSVKNNKLVYVHSKANILIKKKAILKDKKASNPTSVSDGNENNNSPDQTLRKSRGSIYRGVSRNGNQWQVLIMVNKKKRYVGSYDTEEQASRTYDKVCIQNHGIKAKTNHFYTEEEIKQILESPKILRIEDY